MRNDVKPAIVKSLVIAVTLTVLEFESCSR